MSFMWVNKTLFWWVIGRANWTNHFRSHWVGEFQELLPLRYKGKAIFCIIKLSQRPKSNIKSRLKVLTVVKKIGRGRRGVERIWWQWRILFVCFGVFFVCFFFWRGGGWFIYLFFFFCLKLYYINNIQHLTITHSHPSDEKKPWWMNNI